jgi:hypothetical protein
VLVPGTAPLNKEQRDFQSVVGDLMWMTKRVTRLVKAVHHLSCVSRRCPPGAMCAALGVMACAADHRTEGHAWSADAVDASFIGVLKGSEDARRGTAIKKVDVETRLAKGAPMQLEGASDATWARGTNGVGDVICLYISHRGAIVMLELKKAPANGSSAGIEGLGLGKVSDKAVYARLVAEKMGCDMSAPTTLLCDAEAALRAASGQSSVVRLKHEMRRLAIITARIRMGEIVLAHVPDTANAADIFTKWVSSVKFESMLAYLIGSRFCREGAAQVAHTMAALALSVERGESGGLRMLLGET